MRIRWSSLAFALAVGGGLWAPASAGAERADKGDLTRARALDREGVRAYKEERYNDAIRYFAEAFRLGGPPSELWNIAKCHARLDEPEEASKALEEYLAQPGLSASDRAEATQQLQDIKHRHSTVTIASAPAGATVYVDGRRGSPAGTTPLSIDVPPGDHTLTLERAGYAPYTTEIEASYGRAVIVDAPLERTSGGSGARGDANAAVSATAAPNGAPHRFTASAALGVVAPRFGSVGGTAGVAGFLTASYVALDTGRLVVGAGLRLTIDHEGWGNSIGAPTTADACTGEIPNAQGATATSLFAAALVGVRVAPRWRVGGDAGLGLAFYGVDRVGGDVFYPTCSPSPGTKPALHLAAEASYEAAPNVRILATPLLLEAQSASNGARTAPRDASGMWLRFGLGVGLAVDLF